VARRPEWPFLFWIGHGGITLGIVAYMIR